MLNSNYNCNRHFPILPFKPIVRASYQFSILRFPNSTEKQYRRRARIVAAAVGEVESRDFSQSAIRRIAEKLRNLGFAEESGDGTTRDTLIAGSNSPGEIFVPLRSRFQKQRVGHTLDQSWSTPENPVPEPGSGNAIQRFHELQRGVKEEEERGRGLRDGKRKTTPSMAELALSRQELGRLISLGIPLKKRLKVGRAGITEGIVNGIHERWRRSEVVKIACEDICRLNMKRTHELLERKTGGLVVWRSGGNIILYRGPNYKYPYFLADEMSKASSLENSSEVGKDSAIRNETPISSSAANFEESSKLSSNTHIARLPLVNGVGLPNRVRFQLPGEAELAEDTNALLEGLGPRFIDWWDYDPVPVDADLLPAVVPGYKKPFRLLPYGVKPKLTNDELNTLRRLGRPLPCHFAVGRNRKLQGLAAAMVKLWERCEIAKIAIKRGVQNTNSELMSEELKLLTGGTLLSRDKDFIVFYRGKDFLPAAVSSAIDERRKHGINVFKTKAAAMHAVSVHENVVKGKECSSKAEDKKETKLDMDGSYDMQILSPSQAEIERTSTRLSAALAKKAEAERLLEEIKRKENLQVPEKDKEGITEEERYMLRRVGLRMKPFLLMGRRGIFDGTIENMHLHWKYRELVKVCIGERNIEEVHRVARTLEAESGGILVAVEPSSKGYYIIVYRGKNYTRPASLRPRTLLSKREALKVSIEAQRSQSLKLHLLKINKTIDELKQTMVERENGENHGHDDETSSSDTRIDLESSFDVPSDEFNASESHETDGISVDFKSTMSDSKRIGNSILHEPEDARLRFADQTDLLSDKAAKEHVRKSSAKEMIRGSYQTGHRRTAQTPHSIRSQTHGSLPTTGDVASPSRDGYMDAELKPATQNNLNDEPLLPTKPSPISNRERLLLRKLALGMKNPPVLAVGKSNVIKGVAKAIKEHFKKHPLAIVNIKGRAKGTSIQEVIYNLEQATGAVFVSQEPSKVILYRGWGAAAVASKKDRKIDSMGQKIRPPPPLSPELIRAVRMECGLQSDDGEDNSSNFMETESFTS